MSQFDTRDLNPSCVCQQAGDHVNCPLHKSTPLWDGSDLNYDWRIIDMSGNSIEDKPSKPREWWIFPVPMESADNAFRQAPINNLGEIHVIEMSAYLALKAECELHQNSIIINHELFKERDALKAERDQLKREVECYIKGFPSEWYISELQRERDALKAELTKTLEDSLRLRASAIFQANHDWIVRERDRLESENDKAHKQRDLLRRKLERAISTLEYFAGNPETPCAIALKEIKEMT